MYLVQPSLNFPPSGSKEAEAAASFLSEWLNRNSFFPEGRAEDDDGSGEDLPGRTGQVVEGGCNGSDDGREGSEMRDLGISIGQIVCDDDFKVYEDRDPFNASTSTGNLTYYLPSSPKDANFSKGGGKIERISKSKGGTRSPDDGDEGEPKPQVVGRPPKTNSNGNNNKGGPKPTIVIHHPWRDQRGILGKYTGQTDRLMRPHGCGALIYEDGTSVTSIWEDGVPIKSWAPGDKKKKKQQQRSSSNNDDGSSSNSNKNLTYLPHLDLGDIGAPQDATRLDSSQSAFKSISKGKGGPRSPDDGDEGGTKPQPVGRPSKTNSDKNSNNNKGEPKPQIVSGLPWRDQRGILGKYTGQADRLMRPHGCGALIYEDGSSVTSVWEDGIPIKSWAPGDKMKKKQQQRSSSSSNSSSNTCSNSSSNSNRNWTLLPHLKLGDAGAPRDMIRLDSGESDVMEMLNAELQVHDFAFVLRSDGRWTYAIVAEKKEDAMIFVVDGDGQTKTLARKHWAASIRLVNLNEARRSQGGHHGGNGRIDTACKPERGTAAMATAAETARMDDSPGQKRERGAQWRNASRGLMRTAISLAARLKNVRGATAN